MIIQILYKLFATLDTPIMYPNTCQPYLLTTQLHAPFKGNSLYPISYIPSSLDSMHQFMIFFCSKSCYTKFT